MRSFKCSLKDARGPEVFHYLLGFAFCALAVTRGLTRPVLKGRTLAKREGMINQKGRFFGVLSVMCPRYKLSAAEGARATPLRPLRRRNTVFFMARSGGFWRSNRPHATSTPQGSIFLRITRLCRRFSRRVAQGYPREALQLS